MHYCKGIITVLLKPNLLLFFLNYRHYSQVITIKCNNYNCGGPVCLVLKEEKYITFNGCQDHWVQGSFAVHPLDVWDALNLFWNEIVQEV